MDKLLDVNKLYEEDPKLKRDDVELLLTWCQQQRHFPKVIELQAALALHACFYSIEQAKSCIENYFTIRTMVPEFFSGYNPDKEPLLKEAMQTQLLTFLPEKTSEGYRILLTGLRDTNPDVYNPQVGSKIVDMQVMRVIHTEGPGNGIVLILDMKGGVFGHVTKLNLSEFKKFLVYLQTALPVRLMAIHYINVVPFMDKILALVKPFINKEMFQKLIIHTNNENLYKYIPKEAMPIEYGGKAESVDILYEKSRNSIYEYQWFYDYQETNVVNESKRIGPRKNADSLFGFDGTFKKLEVD